MRINARSTAQAGGLPEQLRTSGEQAKSVQKSKYSKGCLRNEKPALYWVAKGLSKRLYARPSLDSGEFALLHGQALRGGGAVGGFGADQVEAGGQAAEGQVVLAGQGVGGPDEAAGGVDY